MSRKKGEIEERYVIALYLAGLYIGIFVLAAASFFAFILAFLRLVGVFVLIFSIELVPIVEFLALLDIERKPVILMLVDIVDAALIGAILLVLTFGFKSVFTGRGYGTISFGIEDIDELKEYLVGLIITLLGTRFLEVVLSAGGGSDILNSGLGIAAVAVALGVYDYILKVHKRIE